MLRWFRSLRETVRVLTGRDDSVQKYIAETKSQILKLREQRTVQAKQLEAKTLAEVRRVVEELKVVKESVDQMERAAVEYVERVGNHAEVLLEETIKLEGQVLEDMIASKRGGAGISSLKDGSMSNVDEAKLLQLMSTLKAEELATGGQVPGSSAAGGTSASSFPDAEDVTYLTGKKPG
eukprot:TRINITY_DN2182_c0_g2_i1.p1 TRINITY_DN2182_c0_g2~~TRINITY_DN2182_c0_g2_i1.p1  ORF type:complete len:179 (+),score=51.00 TRINITY_DN2182_c0_g2_i1:191-727(+)